MTDKNNKPSRPKKTTEESQKASNALHYEINMLNKVADSLNKRKRRKGFIWDALVESFVVHTRILIEFFYPPEKIRYPIEKNLTNAVDTIIAPDFFLDESKWKECLPDWLKDVREHAHKLLAHLSYSRVFKYENDKGWDYLKIKGHLNGLFVKFRKDVSPDRIGDKLKNYKVPLKSDTPVSAILASTGTAYSPAAAVTQELLK
jgi:hypothetical protein